MDLSYSPAPALGRRRRLMVECNTVRSKSSNEWGEMIRGTGSPRGTAALQRHFAALNDTVRASEYRFPDGAHFRIEIPSVENPSALRAVVEEARTYKTPIHRTSQGSGAMLLTRSELREMAIIGADEGLEVNLFVGPREE